MAFSHFVKKPIVAAFHSAVRLNVILQRRKYQYVFILGHMRSGSTLLSHILTSHQDFAGAGETCTYYKTPADLANLVPRTCELLHKFQLDATYIVDQINHNEFVAVDCLSSSVIQKCVILIRAPTASLKSIINVIGAQEQAALDYYVGRLNMLALYGGHLGDRALLMEYDDLVNRSEEVLAALTLFFAVEPPFTNEYSSSKITGKLGDPSKNIHSGSIIRTKGHETRVSAGTLRLATSAFEKCRRELLSAGVQSARGPSQGELQ